MATAARTMDEFRSPVPKLLRFFQSSRDKWKRKCHEAKHQCKLLRNQVRAVEKSRAQWRSRAELLERQLCQHQPELNNLKSTAARS